MSTMNEKRNSEAILNSLSQKPAFAKAASVISNIAEKTARKSASRCPMYIVGEPKMPKSLIIK